MQTSAPQQSETTLHAIDYWQVIKNRYGVILLTMLLVFMTAAVITYVMQPKYESRAIVQIKPRAAGLNPVGAEGGEATRGVVTANYLQNEFEVIRSRKVLSYVMEKLGLMASWNTDRETTLQVLQGIVEAQPVRGTDHVKITVTHPNKNDACNIATEVMRAYRDYREGVENEEADLILQELSKAVRDQQDKVEDRRKALKVIQLTRGIIYSEDEGLNSSPSEERMGSTSATEEYFKIAQQQQQIEAQIKTLQRLDTEQMISSAAGLELPDNIVKTLYPQYLELKVKLDTMRANGLGAKHPSILAQQEAMSTMRKQLEDGVVALRGTLQSQLELAQKRLEKAEEIKATRKTTAINDSVARAEFNDAKREFIESQKMLQALEMKLVSERVTNRIPRRPILIHEEPVIAQFPSSPNVMLNLVLGGVLGLIFGVGIAFFLEYLDTSVKTLEDVERYLQVPVLAVIPKEVGILHKQNGMSPDAEAYRILRTNIEFNRKNPEDNAITVVSGGAGEGKSTTLVNLAYICAQGGYTTLMIDADLRRPRLHTFFDINNSVGLTNYLTTELMLEDVILQTPVDNLYFMPSGILPADAAGILNSRRMSELIQDVKQRFDLVLIDSPPILGVSDASVLASEVDLTMIVVQHRKLPRNMLMRVKQAVESVGGHVIGVVLNNVDVRSDSQYQYYTSYYTYYAPTDSHHAPQQSPMAAAAPQQVSKPSAQPGKSGDDELY